MRCDIICICWFCGHVWNENVKTWIAAKATGGQENHPSHRVMTGAHTVVFSECQRLSSLFGWWGQMDVFLASCTASPLKKKTHLAKCTCTVFLILCEGPGYSAEYRSVRNRELINVDLPKPDSPEKKPKKTNRSFQQHCVFPVKWQ